MSRLGRGLRDGEGVAGAALGVTVVAGAGLALGTGDAVAPEAGGALGAAVPEQATITSAMTAIAAVRETARRLTTSDLRSVGRHRGDHHKLVGPAPYLAVSGSRAPLALGRGYWPTQSIVRASRAEWPGLGHPRDGPRFSDISQEPQRASGRSPADPRSRETEMPTQPGNAFSAMLLGLIITAGWSNAATSPAAGIHASRSSSSARANETADQSWPLAG
jgi:hypothetical protein